VGAASTGSVVADRGGDLSPRAHAADGVVRERELIYERLWGCTMIPYDRSVDVFVYKLRRKLERASPGWGYIHTHFGVGYRFAPEIVVGRARRSQAGAGAAVVPLHRPASAAPAGIPWLLGGLELVDRIVGGVEHDLRDRNEVERGPERLTERYGVVDPAGEQFLLGRPQRHDAVGER